MTQISSQHHSFDISLAARFGMECAVLIHHFQHWIRINQVAKRNIKNGSCWTYQSRKEILEHFPYWNYYEIRRLCEKLVALGVLKTANYNKSKVDKTLWYAFVDEVAFGVDYENSKNLYERQNCPSRGKNALPCVKSAQPIPDTKPDTKTTDVDKSIKRERGKSTTSSPAPDGHYVGLFENKIKITKEQRSRLVEKFGGMESVVDAYAEKLYRYSLKNPSGFKKYARHDLVIEDWMEQDLKKGEPQNKKNSDLNDVQEKNWKLNQELVKELKDGCPNNCGGLHFYYKAYLLKDKKDPSFDLCGYIDHREFCRQLDKRFKLGIEKVVFGDE